MKRAWILLTLWVGVGFVYAETEDEVSKQAKAAAESIKADIEQFIGDEEKQKAFYQREYEIVADHWRLTDFRDENHYVGIYHIGPQRDMSFFSDPNSDAGTLLEDMLGLEASILSHPPFTEYVVSWKAGGKQHKYMCQNVNYWSLLAKLDLPRNRVLVFALKGIYALPLDGTGEPQWLWRLPGDDDTVFAAWLSRTCANPAQQRFIGWAKIQNEPMRCALVAWDASNEKVSMHEISQPPQETIFISNSRALTQLEDRMIWAQFAPDGSCTFIEEAGSKSPWRLEGACGEKLVWGKENDDDEALALRIDNKEYPWPKELKHIAFSFEGGVYGYSIEMANEAYRSVFTVYRLTGEGHLTPVAHWKSKAGMLAGMGRSELLFWFADECGEVHVFGDKPRIVQVPLPQQSYGRHKLIELQNEDGTWRSWSDVLPEFKK